MTRQPGVGGGAGGHGGGHGGGRKDAAAPAWAQAAAAGGAPKAAGSRAATATGPVSPASAGGPHADVAYCFDGTLEGLLSAIFAAYERREDPADVACRANLQPRLGQRIVDIPTDPERALRVQRGICRTCGPASYDAVKCASLSDDPRAGTVAYRFVRHAMAAGKPRACASCKRRSACDGACTRPGRSPLSDVAHPAVEPLVRLSRAVYNERHRMMQFLRFEHLEGGVWFARCSPKANVVPLLMDWFCGRFNTQPFLIHDEAHHLAGVYGGSDWYLVKTDRLNLPGPAADEAAMQRAWRRFYRAVAVESRYNPELRRQFMPKRLWKNITEMQEDLPGKELAATRGPSGQRERGIARSPSRQIPQAGRRGKAADPESGGGAGLSTPPSGRTGG